MVTSSLYLSFLGDNICFISLSSPGNIGLYAPGGGEQSKIIKHTYFMFYLKNCKNFQRNQVLIIPT